MPFVHSEYREKERAAQGANIRDGNGIDTYRNKAIVALPLRRSLLCAESQCIKERTERRTSGESCLSEASYAAARSGVSSFN